MKVKNIMFSGFMAAVLAGACGAADAATVLASKEFVTTELGKKQDTLTAGDGIDITNNKVSAVTGLTDESGNPITLESALADVKTDITEVADGITEVENLVGTLPEGTTATTIVEYVNKQTEGLATDGKITELQNSIDVVEGDVSAIEGKLEGLTGTVAEDIAMALQTAKDYADANDSTYDDTALAGRVSANEANITANAQAITGLESSKADKTALNAYVTSDALSGMGYQTADNVATAIGKANIAMEKVTGLSAALDEKAAASDVESLQTTVEGFTNETTGIAATYATKSELAGYATDDELSAVSDVADEAKATADAALPAATFTTFQETVNAEAIAEAKKAGTDAASALETYKGEVTSALNGKVDDTDLNNYYTKSEADTQFLEDAGLENGAAYLVTKNSEGKVVYSEVSVIGEKGQTVIGKAQQ